MIDENNRSKLGYASLGMAFLLAQVIGLVILLIALAIGLASQSGALLGIVAAFGLLLGIGLALVGTIGKVLCLIAPSSTVGRLFISLSLVGDFLPIVVALKVLPLGDSASLVSGIPVLLLLLYLATLSTLIGRVDIRRTAISALICILIGEVAMGVGPKLTQSDAITIPAAVIAFCVGLYGFLLYIRTLTTLRQGIAEYQTADESDLFPPEPDSDAQPKTE